MISDDMVPAFFATSVYISLMMRFSLSNRNCATVASQIPWQNVAPSMLHLLSLWFRLAIKQFLWIAQTAKVLKRNFLEKFQHTYIYIVFTYNLETLTWTTHSSILMVRAGPDVAYLILVVPTIQ